jgi:hypothetical protein
MSSETLDEMTRIWALMTLRVAARIAQRMSPMRKGEKEALTIFTKSISGLEMPSWKKEMPTKPTRVAAAMEMTIQLIPTRFDFEISSILRIPMNLEMMAGCPK